MKNEQFLRKYSMLDSGCSILEKVLPRRTLQTARWASAEVFSQLSTSAGIQGKVLLLLTKALGIMVV